MGIFYNTLVEDHAASRNNPSTEAEEESKDWEYNFSIKSEKRQMRKTFRDQYDDSDQDFYEEWEISYIE